MKNIHINGVKILLENNEYLLAKDNQIQYLNSDKETLNSIFWYPIVEIDYEEFKNLISELEKQTEFPTLLLLRNIIASKHLYWTNACLAWYEKSDFDININGLLEKILKNDSRFQEFNRKIKNILTNKYRSKAKEIYSKITLHEPNTKDLFIQNLNEVQIRYKKIEDRLDQKYILVSGSKFKI